MQGFKKGYSRFACERVLETEQKLQYFETQTYGRQRCVFLVLQGCSTGGPEAHSAGWWLPLLHLISNFSGPQIPSGFPRAPSAGCGFPYHLSSTPTGTRSLKSHVWSSSSGNNCHAVHRSLSSGASVYECTMRIILARPISSANFRPRDFLS